MSWIIQHLLRNGESIKTSPDIESEEFNNLLTVESKIDELYREGFLSDMDLFIIESMSDGKPMKELESKVDMNRVTISRTFIQICDRISYFLGGYFTDEGFIDNMKKNYKLDDSQIDHIKLHMQGRFKHKLIRKLKK